MATLTSADHLAYGKSLAIIFTKMAKEGLVVLVGPQAIRPACGARFL